jgi:hypothetical protein
MFSSLLSLLVLSPLALAGPCHEDNCYRAVVRKWQGEGVYQQHLADCAVNIACTSTVAAATTTATQTVTAGTVTITRAAATASATGAGAGVNGGLTCGNGKIPSDQSSQCENNFAFYATACGCAGVPTKTDTLPQATATVQVTVTEPASIVYV